MTLTDNNSQCAATWSKKLTSFTGIGAAAPPKIRGKWFSLICQSNQLPAGTRLICRRPAQLIVLKLVQPTVEKYLASQSLTGSFLQQEPTRRIPVPH